MSGPGYACPNGHPATLAGQRFCEVCGAPVSAMPVAPPPVAAPPMAPAPQPAPPPISPAPPSTWPAPAGPPPISPVAPPPGWSTPAAPPPGWSTQPTPAAYGAGTPPTARGGRGRGPLLLIGLLLVAVIGVGGVVLVVRPFGGGAASPGPVAQATSTPGPATAAPTATPTAAPTAAPTVEPTAEPTEEPTLAPIESATAPVEDVASCRSEAAGITVTYPATWSTVDDGSQWACLLFDPAPIEILPDSELPQVAVMIYQQARTYAEVRNDFETAAVYTVVSTEAGVVDDREATGYELENTGEGFYEKGVLQAVIVVDLGGRGTLVIETVGMPGAAYDANVESLVKIVEALQID